MWKIILGLVLLVSSSGCVSVNTAMKTFTPFPPTELITEKSYDRVWDASVKALLDSKYTIKSMDKTKGTIVSDYRYLKIDDFLKSSSSKMCWQYSSSRNNVEISIAQDGDKNTVRIKANIEQHMQGVGSAPAKSNGKIESKILKNIEGNFVGK